MSNDALSTLLSAVASHTLSHIDALPSLPTIAVPSLLRNALDNIPQRLPEEGWGDEKTLQYLIGSVVGGLAQGQSGPRYFGFVTGGVLPSALLADQLATLYDQNVQVHLPTQSISTVVEARSLSLLLDLLSLDPSEYPGRTLTTGATASNILGLACAREYALSRAHPGYSVAEDGLAGKACDVFVAKAHASVVKAASVVGIGRRSVREVGLSPEKSGGLAFDLKVLEELMKDGKAKGKGLIIVAGFGEVNTGGYTPDIPKLRQLCVCYGAWLHIDGAFGAFGTLVPDLKPFVEHLCLADSITVDAHKWLNVPYDTAAFFTRHAQILPSVFGPSPSSGGPAYLTSAPSVSPAYPALEAVQSIPSPLNVNLENSRRFRALPLFAALLSLGRAGYAELVQRNVAFARKIGEYLDAHPGYELLNPHIESAPHKVLLNIVLFRAKDVDATELVRRINETGRCYVSPTSWEGRGAVRIAVSNWMTGLERPEGPDDWEVVKEVLEEAMRG